MEKPKETPPLGKGGQGRLVCDYRCPNNCCKRKGAVMTPAWTMLRELAAAQIMSLCDAYSGFSHLKMGGG